MGPGGCLALGRQQLKEQSPESLLPTQRTTKHQSRRGPQRLPSLILSDSSKSRGPGTCTVRKWQVRWELPSRQGRAPSKTLLPWLVFPHVGPGDGQPQQVAQERTSHSLTVHGPCSKLFSKASGGTRGRRFLKLSFPGAPAEMKGRRGCSPGQAWVPSSRAPPSPSGSQGAHSRLQHSGLH